jgi:hypothetical protein
MQQYLDPRFWRPTSQDEDEDEFSIHVSILNGNSLMSNLNPVDIELLIVVESDADFSLGDDVVIVPTSSVGLTIVPTLVINVVIVLTSLVVIGDALPWVIPRYIYATAVHIDRNQYAPNMNNKGEIKIYSF